jgi:phosphopentomutase
MIRRRACVVVCDGLGVGEAPDAAAYGDEGSHTLGHVLERAPCLLPNLASLGLLELLPPAIGGSGTRGRGSVRGAFGRMREVSAGKDSTTGHWEMMGLVTSVPFPLYPEGFPQEVIRAFEEAIGKRVLGNTPASGTRIIEELGKEHLKSGCPIVYTSGDSVFQIACHESVVAPERLWQMCRVARRILAPPHHVGRVIARPFLGEPGSFVRTANRRDFAVPPHGETFLDRAVASGLRTFGLGKIADIFAGRGLTGAEHTRSDGDGISKTLGRLREGSADFIFTNLVDFDSSYGHRSDVAGYAANLERLDASIPALIAALGSDDLLLLTSDHGCDPSDASTDHTREFVPLLAAGRCVRQGAELGTRGTFADVAATLCEWFGIGAVGPGRSALADLGAV